MMILLTIICLLFIARDKRNCRRKKSDGILTLVFSAVLFFVLVISISLTGSLVGGRVIQEKINLYQEENLTIEDNFDTMVKQYMNYESETYKELSNKSSTVLITMFPELKTNALVEKQLEVYSENNNKVRELKVELINISDIRWWLYFGK